jgi:hypothetical protein
MARYSFIPIVSVPDNPRRYINLKYPSIPRGSQDIYVYVTQGDRYDTLSQTYYKNSDLWWIIARANTDTTSADTLFPKIGAQIRIPNANRIPTIVSEYENINRI